MQVIDCEQHRHAVAERVEQRRDGPVKPVAVAAHAAPDRSRAVGRDACGECRKHAGELAALVVR